MSARRTYSSMGTALADPDSQAAKVYRGFEAVTADRQRFIAARLDEGCTTEEAWTLYLAVSNPFAVTA